MDLRQEGPPTDLLRFMTCGSVDDGKSTLIGRLLYDLGQVFDDQLAVLESDSRKHGAAGEALDLDFSLLVDGLQAEREQGITIDVAYRYFSSPRRKFIVADTPGHEQYTRNMATGASVSELAVILVDARKGISVQTRRHSAIAHLLGIRHVLVAINKMDLVGFEAERFAEIEREFAAFAKDLGIEHVVSIPVAARTGDNIVDLSTNMPWYGGPSLLGHLENARTGSPDSHAGGVLSVQWVNRSSAEFRGYSGSVVRGVIRPGDEVVVLPSAKATSVKSIVTYDGDCPVAASGDAVTIVLEDQVDVSRGDVISTVRNRPEVTDQFSAHLIWLGDEPMLPGRPYFLKCASQTVTASVTTLKHKVSVDSMAKVAGRRLVLNDIGFCNLSCDRPLVFTPYEQNRVLGAFILIDKITNRTVGAGMIGFGLRRAENVHWQAIAIDRVARARQKGQKPLCLWLTGLSGAGKSTIANALERQLFALGHHTYILDGDNIRHGLNRDLGFTDADRVENIRRVAEVAKLMVDSGLITIVSFISPFRSERRLARNLFNTGEFLEVFIDTPLAVCEARDAKGLYKRARAGQIKNFTGIDSDYEPPENPEFHMDAGSTAVDDLVNSLLTELQTRVLI